MRQRIVGLCAVLLMCCVSPFLNAKTRSGLAVTIDVHHVARNTWRVDYRFAEPVTAFTLVSETKGDVYSASMIDAIVLKLVPAPRTATP